MFFAYIISKVISYKSKCVVTITDKKLKYVYMLGIKMHYSEQLSHLYKVKKWMFQLFSTLNLNIIITPLFTTRWYRCRYSSYAYIINEKKTHMLISEANQQTTTWQIKAVPRKGCWGFIYSNLSNPCLKRQNRKLLQIHSTKIGIKINN